MLKDNGRFVPFVEVVWRDAHSSASKSWQDSADVDSYHREPVECGTVGFLVKRDRRGVTVAQSVNSQGQFGGLWHVPAGMILRVHRLRKTGRPQGSRRSAGPQDRPDYPVGG